MQRKEVTFVAGTDSCAAWLYAPAGGESDGTLPLIVMAHGLTGTRRDRLGPFAERFSDAGVAAVVFDHRGDGPEHEAVVADEVAFLQRHLLRAT